MAKMYKCENLNMTEKGENQKNSIKNITFQRSKTINKYILVFVCVPVKLITREHDHIKNMFFVYRSETNANIFSYI